MKKSDLPKLHGGFRTKTTKELEYPKAKVPNIISSGTTVELKFSKSKPNTAYFIDNMGEWRPIYLEFAHKKFRGISKPPSLSRLEKMEMNGVATTPTGKRTEPDGYGSDGSPSWLLVLGLI